MLCPYAEEMRTSPFCFILGTLKSQHFVIYIFSLLSQTDTASYSESCSQTRHIFFANLSLSLIRLYVLMKNPSV